MKSTVQKLRRGVAGGRSRPLPGWKGHRRVLHFSNPKMPSVPMTLDLTLEEYYASSTLMGLLASQTEEPDRKWARDWSFAMGRDMAEEALRRRRKKA